MMVMDAGQIVREYRAAKHKRHEISVLAQLNCCRESEILAVLEEGGVPPKEMPRNRRGEKKMENKKTEKTEKPASSETEAETVEQGSDVDGIVAGIEERIAELVAQRKALLKQLDAIDRAAESITAALEEIRHV